MKDEAASTRDHLASAYLRQLQALACEISVAMDAIAANALPKLQESVANQEMLCASLATMVNTVSDDIRSANQLPLPGIDTEVEQKIRTTRRSILELNLQYAALLKHSSRTVALLSSLCRSHAGQIQEARGPRLKYQTWSCEM
jgi:hypothetical protein